MSNRIWLIASRDFITYLRRPMVWVWIILLGLLYWGLSSGGVQIGTGGDSNIGGAKQHLTSEFEVSRLMVAVTMIVHGFFATVLFGLSVIRDHDTGMMPLLQSSKLKTHEYLMAKFLGCSGVVAVVLLMNCLLLCFFMYVVPAATRSEYFGPFHVANFLKPTVKLIVPSLLLLGGLAFSIGTLTRKPILVFAFPLIFLILFGLFLNSWSPIWLPNWANETLNLIDPYGTRWLNETYFNVDRGAEFYNTQPVTLEASFLASRIGLCLLGLGAFLITVPIFHRRSRGMKHGQLASVDEVLDGHIERSSLADKSALAGLGSLAMKEGKSGIFRDTWTVMRYELKELRFSPSLYLFVPFIILEVVASSMLTEGAFGTPLLQTSGSLAQGSMTVLAVLGCLLLMFYTVESQMRERIKGLAPIYYSTRAKSFAMLFGKMLANIGVCVVIMAAALFACTIILLVQGVVTVEIFPFFAFWWLFLLPTFILWGSFVSLAIVLTRSRYTTYAIGAIAMIATLYFQVSGDMSWLTNWMMTDVARWSDISVFEMDRPALWLNRMFALSLAVLFAYLAAKFYWRRGFDAIQIASRLKPKPIFRFVLRTLPFLALPLVFGSLLWSQVNSGYQGEATKDLEKKYWRQNVATWGEVDPPSVSGVDVVLNIEPADRSLEVTGTMRLMNDRDEPVKRFALSAGTHWKDVEWRLGEKFKPTEDTPDIPDASKLSAYEAENRSGLYVFQMNPPLEPGEVVTLGYSFHGRYPDGVSKNGGGNMEFILPSGVVLTSFGNAFLPFPGFSDETGIDPEFAPETEVYENDFYEDKLRPLFGGGDQFHVRTTITGPLDYRFNGVGVKKNESESEDARTVVWETDSPVSFFNVVGGKWKVHQGKSTEVYYSEKHDYNVQEISDTLEAARVWYSRWFAPYPWRELRLNEFPDMASYAQGFATNITFSEGIGFLTKDKPGADAPFMVTAHEAAHQWWGNILVPGEGPGGNILSEGMAHFSTGLLFDQVKGERARISFFELIEDQYGDRRSVDSERKMVEVDGSKTGDTTVTYDKGGWVFWMLLNHMGRRDNLQGIQSFIKKYSQGPDDYPVLQDFVEHMREFAKDKEAYDEFVQQWFFDTVVPQYKLNDVQVNQLDNKWVVTGKVKNVGTGKMPLEICAAVNDRFIKNDLNSEYLDARSRVTLAEDEELAFEITCDFEPDRVLVDPDAKVLQLKRKLAIHKF